mmetsp:Transcript_23529/g.65226  ORF Transcript_23529/g.65226 Transcript_23529/m.65226 type:complete len:90 (+) Transcript_23529:566-835(+)
MAMVKPFLNACEARAQVFQLSVVPIAASCSLVIGCPSFTAKTPSPKTGCVEKAPETVACCRSHSFGSASVLQTSGQVNPPHKLRMVSSQ